MMVHVKISFRTGGGFTAFNCSKFEIKEGCYIFQNLDEDGDLVKYIIPMDAVNVIKQVNIGG